MSSYQFVNSLTSCYSQGRPDPTAQDYYTPPVQAYGSCFNGPASPAQGYGAPYGAPPQPLSAQNGDHYSSCSQQQRLGATPTPSCKFAESALAASPQDLSTTSSSSQPPESPEPPGQSPTPPTSKSSTSRHLSPDSSPRASPQQSPSPNSQQGASQPSTPQKSGAAFSQTSQPPQIYPWMRKVHVGQR